MENCESQLKNREVEVMESQLKDSEVMLEDPFATLIVVERVMETEIYSTLDIMCKIWIPSRLAIQNLKSMIGLVQSYMTKQRKVDSTTCRMQEAKKIKDILTQVLKLRSKLNSLSPTCSEEKIVNFLRVHKLYATFAESVMTQDTYFEWLYDFEEHTKGRTSVQSIRTSDVSVQCTMEHALESVVMAKSDGGGLDALFNLPTSHQQNNVLSQFISKSENGRIFTLRSPGESGYHQLIRCDV